MYPSVTTIAKLLGTSPSISKDIRGLMEGTINPEQYESVAKWIKQCYHKPRKVELALEAINEILGGCGVEQITDNQWHAYWCDGGLLYVNMGDAYTCTVIYNTRKDKWLVGAWGDVVERDRKRFE